MTIAEAAESRQEVKFPVVHCDFAVQAWGGFS